MQLIGQPRGAGAFEDLLSANLDSLYRTSLRLCVESDDAQDLVQDAVLRAFQHTRCLPPASV